MPRYLAVVFTLLATSWAADPQARGVTLVKTPAVTIASIPPVFVPPGKSGEFQVVFRVERGYHINSHQPHDPLLSPTTLRLSPPTDFMIRNISYPPGQEQTFPFMPEEKLSVYTGDVMVTGIISVPVRVARGVYRVHGTLQYQACDNHQCYSPKEAPFDFDVKVQRTTAAKRSRRGTGQSPHVH
jgi:hypothetical protein